MNVVTILMSVVFLAFAQAGYYEPARPFVEYQTPAPPPPPPKKEYGPPAPKYAPPPPPEPVYGPPAVIEYAPPPPPPTRIVIRRPVIRYIVRVLKTPVIDYGEPEVIYSPPPPRPPATRYGL